MNPETVPHFFIVGAPKCGTTAMAEYLSTHPQIYMSPVKEPHHFADEFSRDHSYQDRSTYLRLFDKRTPEQIISAEASVWYLYAEHAIERIASFNPDAKILVMLRNPADMIYSLHSQLLYNLDEDLTSFEAALEAQADRRAGRRIPAHCRNPQMLQYYEVARYAKQLQRLFSFFPNNQVLTLLFDDFTHNPKEAYETVLRFLDLGSDNRMDFPKINPNKRNRFALISELIQAPPPWLQTLARTAARTANRRELGIWRRIKRLTTVHPKRAPLRNETRAMINTALADELRGLRKIIGDHPWEDRKNDHGS